MMWKYVNFVIAWVGWKFYNAGNSHLTFEGIILIYRWWATSRTTNHRLLVRVHRDRRCRRWSLFMGGGNLIVFALSGKRLQSHKSHNSQTPSPQDTSDSWRKSTGPLWLKSKGIDTTLKSIWVIVIYSTFTAVYLQYFSGGKVTSPVQTKMSIKRWNHLSVAFKPTQIHTIVCRIRYTPIQIYPV